MYFANLSLGSFMFKNFAFRNTTCFSKYSYFVLQNTLFLNLKITVLLLLQNTACLFSKLQIFSFPKYSSASNFQLETKISFFSRSHVKLMKFETGQLKMISFYNSNG